MNTIDIIMGNPLVALFFIIGFGLLLGSVTIKNISLGSSGVLFTALLAGHMGWTVPASVGTLGLVLFVYCVGIGAGGRFFATLAKEGIMLVKLSFIIVSISAGATWLLAVLLNVPPDLAAGIFAGAMTSTPALAAASESLSNLGESALVIGYGISYPFGVAGLVIMIQILPRVLGWDLNQESEKHRDPKDEEQRVLTVLVEVCNPSLVGKRISESGLAGFQACQASRVMRGGKLEPLSYDDVFEIGQKLLLVGRSREIDIAVEYLGKRSEDAFVVDGENERQQLLVTSRAVTGQSLRELSTLKAHGVIVTRVTRLGLTFVPNSSTVIETNDLLTVVGPPANLRDFAAYIGHRSSAIGGTDLLSLSLGLAMGIVLGMIPVGFSAGNQFTLGLAGGPLLAGLILGHFGRLGRIVGHIPRPTRMLLQDLGLVLFLADAGVRGGGAFVETVQAHGIVLFGMGAVITLLPLVLAMPFALRVFRMNKLQALGGICGGMTSTPALGAITSRTESQIPVVSYAAAYPMALILMTVFSKVLVVLLQSSWGG